MGYSSHDEDYEAAFVAIGLGIDSLERHIVADKEDGGLDSSSSSTPDEFIQLGKLFNARKQIMASPVTRNQGEVINMQNLGTSLYLNHDMQIGELASLNDFDIRRLERVYLLVNFWLDPKTYRKHKFRRANISYAL